jgi:hypothetical protein
MYRTVDSTLNATALGGGGSEVDMVGETDRV